MVEVQVEAEQDVERVEKMSDNPIAQKLLADNNRLKAKIAKANQILDEFKIEAPLIQWQDRQFIRISVQGYNSQDDIDALVKALQALLPQVAA